jgi:predicted nucleotidyltransferase
VIFMNICEIKEKREDILRIAKKYGAYNIRIFGSVVRGEAKQDSDLDILVDLEPDRSLLDHAGLIIDLQETMNCKVDVVTEKGLRPRIRDVILKEAIPI